MAIDSLFGGGGMIGGGKPPDDNEMPLTEHLRELKRRVLLLVILVGVITMVSFPFSGTMLHFIWNYLMPGIPMNVFGPLDWMLARIKISLVISLFVGIPVLMYEAVAFMSPGLYQHEKRFVFLIVPPSFILFVAGVSMGFFIVVPLVFKFFIMYSTDVATMTFSVKTTYSMIFTILVGFGAIFQFPLLLIFATWLGLISYETLRSKRIYIYGGLFGASFLVAPDPTGISQLMVAAVLIALFEVSIGIMKVQKFAKERKAIKELES